MLAMNHLCCRCCAQDLSEGLAQRERKVALERSELDQQRRFQDKQAAQLVSVVQLATICHGLSSVLTGSFMWAMGQIHP